METPFTLNEYTDQFMIRQEIELDSLSLLSWLKHQTCDAKLYWACRQGDLEIAAVGLIDSIDNANTLSLEQAISEVESRLKKSNPHIRYFGGQCFDPENIYDSIWDGFGQYRFIVPQYEIIRKGNHYSLSMNIRVDSGMDADQIKCQLRKIKQSCLSQADLTVQAGADQKTAGWMSQKDFPSRSEWISQVQHIIGAIQSGDIKKVVLAQKTELVPALPFNPVTLLEHITSISSQTYNFLFQFPESEVFLGASPESLFKKDGKNIYSEAIAGTRPATGNRQADLQLQNELRESAKELQEHDYVADNIKAALQPICEEINCAEPYEIIQTSLVQHLYSRFQGKLKDHINVYHLLKSLHPTAAVNGAPAGKAMELIRSLEPFSRGWYAGAVGWIMSEQSEFAVAIRSALIQQQQTISVFSGAGIVKDSSPEQEWEETSLKKRLILEAAKEII